MLIAENEVIGPVEDFSSFGVDLATGSKESSTKAEVQRVSRVVEA